MTTATSCLRKMPEIVRATKVQLDYWKDQAWAADASAWRASG